MDTIENIIDKLENIREELQSDKSSVDSALNKISDYRDTISKLKYTKIHDNNILKNLISTFNISNMAEATLIIKYNDENFEILESSGIIQLLDYINSLLYKDKYFYKFNSALDIYGKTLKVFYETMTTEKSIYTIVSITESSFFKPSRFHMLSDIIMDIIRSSVVSFKPLFNDLFETVLIDINRFLLTGQKDISSLFLLKFEYIPVFIENIGMMSIIELSDSILYKLNELFDKDAVVFRISLSRFIVLFLTSGQGYDNFVNYQKSGKLNFSFRGIVLPHHQLRIPYSEGQTTYDIFENIYSIEKDRLNNSIML